MARVDLRNNAYFGTANPNSEQPGTLGAGTGYGFFDWTKDPRYAGLPMPELVRNAEGAYDSVQGSYPQDLEAALAQRGWSLNEDPLGDPGNNTFGGGIMERYIQDAQGNDVGPRQRFDVADDTFMKAAIAAAAAGVGGVAAAGSGVGGAAAGDGLLSGMDLAADAGYMGANGVGGAAASFNAPSLLGGADASLTGGGMGSGEGTQGLLGNSDKAAMFGGEGYGAGMSGAQTGTFDSVLGATGSPSLSNLAANPGMDSLGQAAKAAGGAMDWTDIAKLALSAYGAYSSKDKEQTQTQQREPWGPAQPLLMSLLQQTGDLNQKYKAQPFNDAQKAGYQNQFGLLNALNAQAPSLLANNNALMQGYDRYADPKTRARGAQFQGIDPSAFQGASLFNFKG